MGLFCFENIPSPSSRWYYRRFNVLDTKLSLQCPQNNESNACLLFSPSVCCPFLWRPGRWFGFLLSQLFARRRGSKIPWRSSWSRWRRVAPSIRSRARRWSVAWSKRGRSCRDSPNSPKSPALRLCLLWPGLLIRRDWLLRSKYRTACYHCVARNCLFTCESCCFNVLWLNCKTIVGFSWGTKYAVLVWPINVKRALSQRIATLCGPDMPLVFLLAAAARKAPR